MSANPSPMQRMVAPCGTTELAKQNRSIDLATGFLIAIFNIMEISVIARLKRKKKIYEVIVLSLSVSDCMFGLSNVIVSSIVLSQNCGNNLFGRAYAFYVFFVTTSIFHLIFIAVDRLMIVLIPFRYEAIFTTKRLKIGIAVLWILALVIGTASYLTYELTTPERSFRRLSNSIGASKQFTRTHNQSILTFEQSITKRTNLLSRNNSLKATPETRQLPMKQRFQPNAQLVLSIIIVTLDFLMVSCYSTIIYQMSLINKKNTAKRRRKEHRLPILCVAIASTFIIFTLPYAITRFYLGHVPFWANYILILNSGMNSIVYFFGQRIRKYQKSRKIINTKQTNMTKCSSDIKNISRDMPNGEGTKPCPK